MTHTSHATLALSAITRLWGRPLEPPRRVPWWEEEAALLAQEDEAQIWSYFLLSLITTIFLGCSVSHEMKSVRIKGINV